MVSNALEFSVNLSGTMVLFIYMTTLLFTMWGIEKFMNPRTFVMNGVYVNPDEFESSSDSEEEEGETQEEAAVPAPVAQEQEKAEAPTL